MKRIFLPRSDLNSGFRNLFCAFFAFSLGTQAALGNDSLLTLADRLCEYQTYSDAITEYKRFIFFNPRDSKKGYSFYKMGLAFRSIASWPQASESLRMALKTLPVDSLKDNARIDLAITLMASSNHSLARYQLLKVIHFSRFKSKRRKALFFQGVNDLYLFDWSDAYADFQAFFSKCEQPECERQASRILPLLRQGKSLSYKSPAKAKILSTFLPGLGQAYVGNYWKGLNALMLNSLMAVLIVDSVRQKNYFDVVVSFSLLTRFFLGNRENASKLAENYNLSLNRESAEQILKMLISVESDSVFNTHENSIGDTMPR